MSEITPKKNHTRLSNGFSPINLPESPAASPQKNLTGYPRVARDLIADIYNNIQKWNDSHIKGAQIVKQIAIIKADNPGKYCDKLEVSTNELFEIVQLLENNWKLAETYLNQFKSLTKLEKTTKPLFITHALTSLSQLVEDIVNAYKSELEVKRTVLENIAHSKSENEAMFFAAYWTYQININEDINRKLEILLIESGHRKID